MKRTLILIFTLVALGLLSMTVLHFSTDMPNRQANGFERKFFEEPVEILAQHTFPVKFRELTGTHDGKLYLMGENPSLVYVIDEQLAQMDSIKLLLSYVPKFIPRFYGLLDYPRIHLLGGNAFAMITAHLEKDSVEVTDLNLPGFFSNPVYLGDGEFMLQVIDSISLDAFFVRMNEDGEVIQEETNLSTRQGDAGFLSSGQLRHDKASGVLSYVQFNSHHWMAFDPSMHLHRRGNTIDTNSSIKTEFIRHDRNVNYKKPPMAVNAYTSVYNEILYVRSKLRADQESSKDFRHHAVIDAYDMILGEYEGSFYLPHPQEGEIQQFYVLDKNRLLALTGGTVTIFQIPRELSSKKIFNIPYDID